MAANSVAALTSVDYDKHKEYLTLQSAADNAPLANGEIRFLEQDQWRLPDGKRLIHLAFAIISEFQLRKQEVKLDRDWGQSGGFFPGTLGGCFTETVYHMTNALTAAEEIVVRIVVYDGSAESMRSLIQTYHFPDDPGAMSGYFQVYEHGERLTLPTPVPAKRLYLSNGDERKLLLSKLPPAETGGIAGSNPDGRCAPLDSPGGTETITAEFYSEESYEYFPYQFVPRQIEPEFR